MIEGDSDRKIKINSSPKVVLVMAFTGTENKVGHNLRAKMFCVNYFDKRKDHSGSHRQKNTRAVVLKTSS